MYVRSTKLEKTSLSFANGLSANGDGEIRTLDPLLARQVLSQLSYTQMCIRDSLYTPPVTPWESATPEVSDSTARRELPKAGQVTGVKS